MASLSLSLILLPGQQNRQDHPDQHQPCFLHCLQYSSHVASLPPYLPLPLCLQQELLSLLVRWTLTYAHSLKVRCGQGVGGGEGDFAFKTETENAASLQSWGRVSLSIVMD